MRIIIVHGLSAVHDRVNRIIMYNMHASAYSISGREKETPPVHYALGRGAYALPVFYYYTRCTLIIIIIIILCLPARIFVFSRGRQNNCSQLKKKFPARFTRALCRAAVRTTFPARSAREHVRFFLLSVFRPFVCAIHNTRRDTPHTRFQRARIIF